MAIDAIRQSEQDGSDPVESLDSLTEAWTKEAAEWIEEHHRNKRTEHEGD